MAAEQTRIVNALRLVLKRLYLPEDFGLLVVYIDTRLLALVGLK